MLGCNQPGEIGRRPCGGELPAGLPKDAELEEGGLGDGDEPGFDEHLLDGLIELLDDLLDDLELLAGTAGDDEVAFIVDHELGPREQLRDRLFDRGVSGVPSLTNLSIFWVSVVVVTLLAVVRTWISSVAPYSAGRTKPLRSR